MVGLAHVIGIRERGWISSSAICLVSLLFALAISPSVLAQNSAQALLERVKLKAGQTRSLRAHVVLMRRGLKGEVLSCSGMALLEKPNLASIRLQGDDPDAPLQVDSDGRDLYTVTSPTTYKEVSVDSIGAGIREPWWTLPLRFFFVPSLNPFGSEPDPTATYTLLPDETRDGRKVHVIGIEGRQVMSYTERVTVDAADRIIGTEVNFGTQPGAAFFKAELSDIKTDFSLTPAAFRFSAPAGAELKVGSLADLMLPIGEAAPDFRLPDLAGQPVTFSAKHLGARATLVNFWFLNCPPCRIEFPDFENLYTDLHAKGLNVVAIDKGDESAEVAKYVHRAGLTFPVLLGGQPDAKSVFARYRVADIYPATYLLDAQGHIVYRATGGDLAGLRKALASLGVE